MNYYQIAAWVITFLFTVLVAIPTIIGSIFDFKGGYWTLVKFSNSLVLIMIIFVFICLVVTGVFTGKVDIIERIIEGIANAFTYAR